ncbi:MAG: NAD-dependent deacylase [Synergistaceae bacterium]|nr:NAD-dependent deacylase [Synergistaceae bacterium]
MDSENGAKWLADKIKKGRVVVFSGAGLSTESGLQDFRSRDGIWSQVDPAEMASVGVLERRYDEFLEFYKARLYVPDSIKPNIGHKLIAEWEASGYVTGVITQNIDRLHQRAGSKRIAELHGSLEPVICHSCGREGTTEDFLAGKPCSYCGGHLRPSVVLFGEMLPQQPLNWADQWSSDCDTFIVLGSSLVVSPANYFPRQAKNHGAELVIINRDETPLDSMADLTAHEGIGDYLTKVSEYMK